MISDDARVHLMHSLRARYQLLSFRRRLLLLLIAVAAVQVVVASWTFFDLQSRPAREQVQSQLDAAVRGAAPVVDNDLAAAGRRVTQLANDTEFTSAIQTGNWGRVSDLLAASSDTSASQQQQLGAYVTDSRGAVVAGTKPDGVYIEQPGLTSTTLSENEQTVATVHVPLIIDAQWLRTRVKPYAPKQVDVFIATDDRVIGTDMNGGAAFSRPSALRDGRHALTLGGGKREVLARSMLDGSVLLGASMTEHAAAARTSAGMNSLIGFVTLLAALMLGMSWYISRAVGDALRAFVNIAKDLAAGNLGRRVPVTGTDEVANLATSFNDMAESLQDRIVGLEQARASMRRQVELFGDALANATAMEDMLRTVVSLAMESTPATHGRFWTLDEEGHYQHAACVGLRPADTEPCSLERQVPVRNHAVRSSGSPAWLVAPARLRDGQIVGLLTLVSLDDEFTNDDVRMAERIAVQAAVAIDNARMHEQLKLQATRDGLTGLPNHRSLQDELTQRLADAHASGTPLGVCLLDIDNFKRVNDTYGHPVGDEAIKAIGATLARGVGDLGMVGRYGGEEFVVIMPGCDADASCRIADRLRDDITHIEIPLDDGGILTVTSSFGVANVDQQHDGVLVDNAELLHQADVGLYNAKRTGKNRYYLAGPDTTVIEMSDVEKAKLAARERGDVAAEQHAAAQLEDVSAPHAA